MKAGEICWVGKGRYRRKSCDDGRQGEADGRKRRDRRLDRERGSGGGRRDRRWDELGGGGRKSSACCGRSERGSGGLVLEPAVQKECEDVDIQQSL
jgi:hypothetical protein